MWSFLDYRYRLVNAVKTLDKLIEEREPTANFGHPDSIDALNEVRRLRGKREGVMLALSYFDEMNRENG